MVAVIGSEFAKWTFFDPAKENELTNNIVLLMGALFITVIFVVAIFLCYILDAYHSQQEKRFRALFDRVRKQPPLQRPDFCMSLPQDIIGRFPLWNMIIPPSGGQFYRILVIYYGYLIAATVYLFAA